MYRNEPELLPSDEEVAKMYEMTSSKLARYGFEQYEVSNYAKKGCRSLHNLMYWEADREFLAFGNGAASFVNEYRFSRPRGIKQYFTYVDQGCLKEGGEQETPYV